MLLLTMVYWESCIFAEYVVRRVSLKYDDLNHAHIVLCSVIGFELLDWTHWRVTNWPRRQGGPPCKYMVEQLVVIRPLEIKFLFPRPPSASRSIARISALFVLQAR